MFDMQTLNASLIAGLLANCVARSDYNQILCFPAIFGNPEFLRRLSGFLLPKMSDEIATVCDLGHFAGHCDDPGNGVFAMVRAHPPARKQLH